jgi:putative ABC transport system substrate-binding protein
MTPVELLPWLGAARTSPGQHAPLQPAVESGRRVLDPARHPGVQCGHPDEQNRFRPRTVLTDRVPLKTPPPAKLLVSLLTLALALLGPPISTEAQQAGKTFRIALFSTGQQRSAPFLVAFEQRLRELGYVEGQNVAIEFRTAEGKAERFPGIMAEFVGLKPDLIVAGGPEAVLQALRKATTTIPIVFVAIEFDPVVRGHVASLARPGGNVTGITLRQTELAAKRVELLREALPGVTRVAVFWDSFSADQFNATEKAIRSLGLQPQTIEFRQPPYDFAGAFKLAERGRAEAVLSVASPVLWRERATIAELAARYRLPVVSSFGEEAEAGALLTYGTSLSDMYRHAATHADKVLKGARPADLPMEQPTRFELVLNLKTAKALGVTIPQSVLLRADQLIR